MRRLITAGKLSSHAAFTGGNEAVAMLVEDGRIAAITSPQEAGEPDHRMDFADGTICPAYMDVHVHGGMGHDVMEATPEALKTVGNFLAAHGVGSYLATTVTAPTDILLKALAGLSSIVQRPPTTGATPFGIHLEGPFLSHEKRGVHPPADLQKPSIALFDRFWEASEGTIRLMTIAPEVTGADSADEALALIEHAVRLGVRISLGHSNADADITRRAIAAGAVSATHTFNAMRPLDHRDPGILGTVLDTEALYAELICDGIHVDPALVRLFRKAKGADRAILITDGISAAGMPDGEYQLGGLKVQVSHGRCTCEGRLAGSVLTLDQAVRNFIGFTNAGLEDTLLLVTRNPAAMVGLNARGNPLDIGQPANFNVVSPDGSLYATYLRGEPVHGHS